MFEIEILPGFIVTLRQPSYKKQEKDVRKDSIKLMSHNVPKNKTSWEKDEPSGDD